MAKYQITAPDGSVHEITAPDDASEADVMAFAQQQLGGAAPAPASQPSTAVDMLRSVPGGLAKGVTAIAGIPGDLQRLADIPARYLAGLTGGNSDPNVGRYDLPSSDNLSAAVAKPFGGYYEPQTTAGKYTEAISSFAPAALAPGSMATRIARTVVPGAASETAGELTQGTPLEPYARVGGALLGAGAIPAGRVVGNAAKMAANKVASAAGKPFLNPSDIAIQKLQDAIIRDGGLPFVQQNVTDWTNTGASGPSLVDVTGNNVLRLARAAAAPSEGQAQNTAIDYANRIAANLQDNATRHAMGLTPNETRPANLVLEDLKTSRDDQARQDYAGPYSEPATVTKEMVSALQGPEGRSAISRAYAAARANRDTQQMSELQDLSGVAQEQGGGRDPITGKVRSIADALQNLSAGSLDRVRIAMRERANDLFQSGARDIARGYKGRVFDIDTALDQTPGLQDARKVYRDYSNMISGMDVGSGGLNTPASDYTLQLGDLASKTPGLARQAAGVGYRQAITDAIQRPAEGATGTLNRLASSDQQASNLATTYGPAAADKFQGGLKNEIARLSKARTISPNTGSQTAPRMDDQALVATANLLRQSWVDRILSVARAGATLTPDQRAEIVRLATKEAELRRVIANMPTQTRTPIAPQIIPPALLARTNGNSGSP